MVFEFVYLAFQMLVRLAPIPGQKEAELEAGMSWQQVNSCGQNSMWTVPSGVGEAAGHRGDPFLQHPGCPPVSLAGRP